MSRESHQVFLSYARKDNASLNGAPGRVTTFVQRLKQEYFASTQRTLEVFFDVEDIQGMDQWRQRILQDLERSYILLGCLSPAYLASEYCQWEFTEYLKGEISLALSGSGIAPVYAFEIPNWFESDYEKNAPEWVQMLRTRQMFDLHTDFGMGTLTAPSSDNFKALTARLAARIRQAEDDERSPGFVDRQRSLRVAKLKWRGCGNASFRRAHRQNL